VISEKHLSGKYVTLKNEIPNLIKNDESKTKK